MRYSWMLLALTSAGIEITHWCAVSMCELCLHYSWRQSCSTVTGQRRRIRAKRSDASRRLCAAQAPGENAAVCMSSIVVCCLGQDVARATKRRADIFAERGALKWFNDAYGDTERRGSHSIIKTTEKLSYGYTDRKVGPRGVVWRIDGRQIF